MPLKLYLDKRQNKHYEAPIRVVWSFNGDRYQTTMGFSIPPQAWDSQKCRVTPAAYNHKNTASMTFVILLANQNTRRIRKNISGIGQSVAPWSGRYGNMALHAIAPCPASADKEFHNQNRVESIVWAYQFLWHWGLKKLWHEFAEEFDKQVISGKDGKVRSCPTNLANSKYTVYLHMESKGKVPHRDTCKLPWHNVT